MSYLTEGFTLVSIENHWKSTFFAAVVMETRPPMDELQKMGMFEVKLPERSPVAWLGAFADESGVLLLMSCKKPVILGNAKIHLDAVLKCQGSDKVVKRLLPLDTLHAQRIRAWKTPEDLRPPLRPKSMSRADLFEWLGQGGNLCNIPKSDSGDYDWDAADGVLKGSFKMLADREEPSPEDSSEDTLAIRCIPLVEQWQSAAQESAVMFISEAGERPRELCYRSLQKQKERQMLACQELMREMSDNPDLSHAYAAAKQLITEGHLPDWVSPKDRRLKRLHEFCQEVTEELGGQCDNLPKASQSRIEQVLGNDVLADGCLMLTSFADGTPCKGKTTPEWEGGPGLFSTTCGHCFMPAAFGRTWYDAKDPKGSAWDMVLTMVSSGISHETYARVERNVSAKRRRLK